MEEIKRQRSQLQKIAIGCFAILIVALALWMFQQSVPALVLVACVILFYFVFYRKQASVYNDTIARTQILEGICKDGNGTYIGKEGLSADDVRAFKILPIRKDSNTLLLRQGFTCSRSECALSAWEMTLHYQNVSATRMQFLFLSGTLVKAKLPAPLTGDCLLLHNNMLDETSQVAFLKESGYHRIIPHSQKLSADYHVYAEYTQELPEDLEQHLVVLAEKVSSMGALRLCDDLCAVYLYNRFYTQNVKIRDLPTEEALHKNPLPEMDTICAFLEYLNSNAVSSTKKTETATVS